jgi:soluble P-type ATPase
MPSTSGKSRRSIENQWTSPDGAPRPFRELVLDYNGTVALDGSLLPGIGGRLRKLSQFLKISVLTADTFGKAERELKGLPVEVLIIRRGRDKADFISKRNPDLTIAIGNGRNDMPMLAAAGLGIAVIGPEGAAGELMSSADVIVTHIHHALDLIIHPLRLKAVLRD